MAAVRDWSDGRYTKAGCSLKFILDWAWARVVEIKVSLIQSQSQSDPKGNLASGLSLKSYGPSLGGQREEEHRGVLHVKVEHYQ